jgi:hypothetical protein
MNICSAAITSGHRTRKALRERHQCDLQARVSLNRAGRATGKKCRVGGETDLATRQIPENREYLGGIPARMTPHQQKT